MRIIFQEKFGPGSIIYHISSPKDYICTSMLAPLLYFVFYFEFLKGGGGISPWTLNHSNVTSHLRIINFFIPKSTYMESEGSFGSLLYCLSVDVGNFVIDFFIIVNAS